MLLQLVDADPDRLGQLREFPLVSEKQFFYAQMHPSFNLADLSRKPAAPRSLRFQERYDSLGNRIETIGTLRTLVRILLLIDRIGYRHSAFNDSLKYLPQPPHLPFFAPATLPKKS